MERALEKLDLLVSLDFYVNETNSHADYVLPTTTFLERDDVPVAFLGFFTTPFIQFTERGRRSPPARRARNGRSIDELARAHRGRAVQPRRAALRSARARRARDAAAG